MRTPEPGTNVARMSHFGRMRARPRPTKSGAPIPGASPRSAVRSVHARRPIPCSHNNNVDVISRFSVAAPTTAMVANSDGLVRAALAYLLQHVDARMNVIEVADAAALLERVREGRDVHLVLLDDALPGGDGRSLVCALRKAYPLCSVVVLTDAPDPEAATSFHSGCTVLCKSAAWQELPHAIRCMLDSMREAHCAEGLALLSPRQRQVLRELVAGKSNKQIAATLGLSPNTVRRHLYEVFRQLKVKTRGQAAALFVNSHRLP